MKCFELNKRKTPLNMKIRYKTYKSSIDRLIFTLHLLIQHIVKLFCQSIKTILKINYYICVIDWVTEILFLYVSWINHIKIEWKYKLIRINKLCKNLQWMTDQYN